MINIFPTRNGYSEMYDEVPPTASDLEVYLSRAVSDVACSRNTDQRSVRWLRLFEFNSWLHNYSREPL